MADQTRRRPLVSVVVPNYNHAAFLRRRLDSIFEQTLQDFEVIILDDCSTDGSLAIIDTYRSDPRVSFHPSETNSGSTFVQWNRGATLAQGEYLWFAESDDYAAPRQLETLVGLLQANPRLAVAYCQSTAVDARDQVLGSLLGWTVDLDGDRWQRCFVNDGRDECRRYLLWKCTIPNASAALVRREAYWRAGGAPTHLRLCGDWMTWVRILMVGDIAFTPESLNYFRAHESTQRQLTPWRKFVKQAWLVQRYILQKVDVPTAERRRLAHRTFFDIQRCWQEAAPNERWTELRACLRAAWPILGRAPETTAKLLFKSLRAGARPAPSTG